MASEQTKARLKEIVVESLNLEGVEPSSIGDDEPLFGGELGLDSVDALELVVALEREYGVRIESGEIAPEAFSSIASLADLVEQLQAGEGAADAG